MTKEEIIKRTLEINGEDMQLTIAMEECSELIKECSKMIRKRGNVEHLIEEMADVYIILEELQMLYNISPREIDNEISLKITRQNYRNEGIE